MHVIEKGTLRLGETAQQVKAPGARLDQLSLMPRIGMGEGTRLQMNTINTTMVTPRDGLRYSGG